jgi:virginiamycin B lyase
MWFTEAEGNKIGRITTTGAITEFAIPTASSVPVGIVAGPDGNLWFTEHFGNKIGRITTGGSITEFAIPTASSFPVGIVTGPDGNMWFTEAEGNKIGRITVALAADLSIAQSGSPNRVVSGDHLTYTLTAINNGPQDATGVKVTDTLPDVHFNSVSATQGTCTRSTGTKHSPTSGTVTCSLGGLSNGGSATITIGVTATRPATLTNRASVTGDQQDPDPANNSATATTTVVGD